MKRIFCTRLIPTLSPSLSPSLPPSHHPLLLSSLTCTRFASSSPFDNLLYAHHEVPASHRSIWKELGELMKLAPQGQIDPNSLKSYQNILEKLTQSPTQEVVECLQDVFHVYANPKTTLIHEEGLRALLIEKEKCWDPENDASKISNESSKFLMLKIIMSELKKNPLLSDEQCESMHKALSKAWDDSYEECLPEVDKARTAFFVRAFDLGEDLQPYDLLEKLGAKEPEEEGEEGIGVSLNDFVERFRKFYLMDVSNRLLSAPEYKGLASLVEQRMGEKVTKIFQQ